VYPYVVCVGFQWRSAEKYSDKPAEEGESEGAKPAAVSSGPPRVLIDDFVEKLREDAYLSDALLAGAHRALCH
jgi:hypothetical protein